MHRVFDPSKLDSETARRLTEKLAREFGPLVMEALADDTVNEITVNADGTVWVEKLSGDPQPVGQTAPHLVQAVIGTMAAHERLEVNHLAPLFGSEIPYNGARFQGFVPPVVQAPSFSIRKPASRLFTLDEYVEQGVMTPAQRQLLLAAIDARRNILVVGGTGSGKTTLANALLHAISVRHPDQRVITVEDTRELQCAAPNTLALRTSDTVSMTDLIKAAMRARPDRVIVGEVRDGAALDILDVWNTGHEGGLATVHANSAQAGLNRIEALVRRNPAGVGVTGKEIAGVVHVSVFIARTSGGRKVRAIETVAGHDGSDYLFDDLDLGVE